jgi:hypothetical protein
MLMTGQRAAANRTLIQPANLNGHDHSKCLVVV